MTEVAMQFKIPQNNEKYHWTLHSIEKMKYYGLSAQKVLGVIRRPQRVEKGIVKNTIAVMQPVSPKTINGKTTWKKEIWAMYQTKKSQPKPKLSLEEKLNTKIDILRNILKEDKKIKIISAWRYPGVSPKNNPIPEDILREIEEGDLEAEERE